ncbi:hypothetical protein N9L23_06325 [Alphaproteobacteria bacterium]|nr:hypothetical protein [Alphaproteobacteria bacterium]
MKMTPRFNALILGEFSFIALFVLVAQSTRLLSHHLGLTSPLFILIVLGLPIAFAWRLSYPEVLSKSVLIVPGLALAALPFLWFNISVFTFITNTPTYFEFSQFMKGWAIEAMLFSSFILFWLSGCRSPFILIFAIVFSCLFGGVVVTLQEFGLVGQLYGKTDFEYLTFDPVAKYQNMYGELKFRNGGISGNWHDAANFISIGVFACLASCFNLTQLRERATFGLVAFFLTVAVALTQSRASLLVLLVAIALWSCFRIWMFLQRSQIQVVTHRIKIGAVLIALMLVGALLASSLSTRIMLFSTTGPLSDGSRLQSLLDSYTFLFSEKWLMALGFGFGSSGAAVVSGNQIYPVNLVDFVSVITLAQYGLAGFLIKILLFSGMLVLLFNVFKSSNASPNQANVGRKIIAETGMLMLIAILLSFLVGEFALNRGFLAVFGCVYAILCNLTKDQVFDDEK